MTEHVHPAWCDPAVLRRTVRGWLSRIDKDSKEARDRRIFAMWLACWTDDAIGEEVGLSGEAVRQITQKMEDLPELGKSDQAAAEHATDFDQPIYNIWKQQDRTPAGPWPWPAPNTTPADSYR